VAEKCTVIELPGPTGRTINHHHHHHHPKATKVVSSNMRQSASRERTLAD